VAYATRLEAHEDLAAARLGEVELLHDEGLAELLKHRRPDPHRRNLSFAHGPRFEN
jgi:hypothetical protein